jgi:hypothetical protein
MKSEPETLVRINDLGAEDPLEAWRWLFGAKPQMRLLTAMGDVFVLRPKGMFGGQEVCLLDTYSGELRFVEKDWESFKERMAAPDEAVSEWLKFDLLCELHEAGAELRSEHCFSPTIPPIIGGKFEPSNLSSTPWRVHLSILGQIHRQVRDMPPGTRITGIDVDTS